MNFDFIKACVLGNDFVILFDQIVTSQQAKFLADRRYGIGCDQVITVDTRQNTTPFVLFFNADGSESYTCGNGIRIVATLLSVPLLKTLHTLIPCRYQGPFPEVNMGKAVVGFVDLPLSDSSIYPLTVNLGNPHLVYLVDDLSSYDLKEAGPWIEHHPFFPERTNVQFAQVKNHQYIDALVWERGTGLTPACGSGACAIAATAYHRGLIHSSVTISMPGGSVHVCIDDDGLWLSSETKIIFRGTIDLNNF